MKGILGRICRTVARVFGFPLLALAIQPVSGATIYESAALGPTDISTETIHDQEIFGTNVTASVFVGVRFQVTKPARTSRIGGHFVGDTDGVDTFFGALVRLDDAADLPDSADLSTPDVLGATILTFPEPSAEVFGDLSVTLDPGWYAVVFGSGLFGAEGGGAAVRNNPDIGSPSYIAQQFTAGGWIDLAPFLIVDQRFVVEGNIIPEPISLDIKPGSDENSVNLKSKGVLPMAVLSTDDFDVLDINVSTLMFGDPLLLDNNGTAAGPLRYAFEDVSDDGLLDLTLKFSMRDLVAYDALGPDTIEGLLTGALFDGTLIEGLDSIRIVPPNGNNASSGNSLQASAIPEPSSFLLAAALLALLSTGARRRSF